MVRGSAFVAFLRTTWTGRYTYWDAFKSAETIARAVAKVLAWVSGTEADYDNIHRTQAALLRDLVGPLPFREVRIDPAWLTWKNRTVRRPAEVAYEEREMPSGHLDRGKLAVLADALEESGCADEEVLVHLRGPGPCVRGCWVIDLLLQKESNR